MCCYHYCQNVSLCAGRIYLCSWEFILFNRQSQSSKGNSILYVPGKWSVSSCYTYLDNQLYALVGLQSLLIVLQVFFEFSRYFSQHCFICRPSDSTVSEAVQGSEKILKDLENHQLITESTDQNVWTFKNFPSRDTFPLTTTYLVVSFSPRYIFHINASFLRKEGEYSIGCVLFLYFCTCYTDNRTFSDRGYFLRGEGVGAGDP